MRRDELLQLTPARYLADGYRDARGLARPELTSLWAAAATEQLKARGVTAATFDPLVAEVARSGQPPASAAPGADFVRACLAQVRTEADRGPCTQHLAAVLRLLALSEASASLNRPSA